MRESQFIKQNREKWHEFEKILHAKQYDPDKLSNLFIQITEDLSYARTFYPHRTVRYYLNSLSQKIYSRIYRYRSFSLAGFRQFWSDELPYIIYKSRRQLILSAVIFTVAMLLGVLASAYDKDFTRLILGEQYVEMTIGNIEKSDPMAVYKNKPGSDMFLYITWNNIRVSFTVFVFGLLAGIGAIYILIYNALMLGAFQYFFHQYEQLDIALVTLWQHGTLEIASIVIAGAAGIVLGRGLAFPGTYTRAEAFRLSANQGIKIVLGTVPLFILAGFIESFITRNTEAPLLLRLMVIIASVAFILFYFVWLPWHKNRRNLFKDYRPARVPPSAPFGLKPGITGNADIIKGSFAFVKSNFSSLVKTGTIMASAALAMMLALYYHQFEPNLSLWRLNQQVITSPLPFLADTFSLFNFSQRPLMILPALLLFSWLTHLTMKRIALCLSIQVPMSFKKNALLLLITALPLLPALVYPWITAVLWFIIAPFWFALVFKLYIPGLNDDIPGTTVNFISKFYLRFMGIIIISLLISALMFLIFATPVMFIYTSFVVDHIAGMMIPENIPYLIYIATTGIICIALLFPLVVTGVFMKYTSLHEIMTARSLIAFFEELPVERSKYVYQKK